MEKKIAIIGHAYHGKTMVATDVAIKKTEAKNINEIIEDRKSITITAPPVIQFIEKSGKEKRRERRANKRKHK